MQNLFIFTFFLALICVINCADSLGAEPKKNIDMTIGQAEIQHGKIIRSKRSKSGGGAEIGRNVGENIGRMTEDITDSLTPALNKIAKSALEGTKGLGDSFKSLRPSSKKGSDNPMKSNRTKSSSEN